jgi:hypothetical protein
MDIEHLVYEDGVVAVGLVEEEDHPNDLVFTHLALRWLAPGPNQTNYMGGETPWLVIPHTFACAIGRTMVQQKQAGLEGFEDDGFALLVKWLIESEELPDCMCY